MTTRERTRVLFVCTGNAARSVIAGELLRRYGRDLDVRSAGTHAVDGLPPGRHVRAALRELGVQGVAHRSRQLTPQAAAEADVVVGLSSEHVAYVRRVMPEHAPRTASLRRLARDLEPTTAPLPRRLRSLALERVDLEHWEDVADPAGADLDTYRDCAAEIDPLVVRLVAGIRGTASLF